MPVKRKKSIKAFLTEEDGKISKKALLSIGVALTAGAISVHAGGCNPCLQRACTKQNPGHCWNHSNAVMTPEGTTAGHQHHYNHGSHASHSSHGSHGSGGGT
jgi:hypothetical protein